MKERARVILLGHIKCMYKRVAQILWSVKQTNQYVTGPGKNESFQAVTHAF